MKRFADPAAVEAELRRNQQEFSPNEARTSLFNLVVYTVHQDDARLIEALNYLHDKRPTRVIVVHRNSGGETRTEVTARCVTDNNEKLVCIQEIVIYSGDDKAGESPEFWTPLLIRDIPVFVWWLCPLEGAPVPDLFDDIADRVLIDSTSAPDAHAFFSGFSKKFSAMKTPVSDFSWVRLGPLLKLTANFFNPPDMRERLHLISKVTLDGGRQAEAELYFQWLKTRMGWKGAPPVKGKPWRLTTGAGSVDLLHQAPSTLEAGFSLTFETTTGETLRLKDSKEGFAVADGLGTSKYTSVFRHLNTGKALVSEVDKNASDRLFQEVLKHWT